MSIPEHSHQQNLPIFPKSFNLPAGYVVQCQTFRLISRQGGNGMAETVLDIGRTRVQSRD